MLIEAARTIVECPSLSSCFSSQLLHEEVGATGFDGGVCATTGASDAVITAGTGKTAMGAGTLTGGAADGADVARRGGAGVMAIGTESGTGAIATCAGGVLYGVIDGTPG